MKKPAAAATAVQEFAPSSNTPRSCSISRCLRISARKYPLPGP
ncbi:hypothetical protein PXO_05746 [Xanthomonas oryzae pv. oryzae PXO99A]|uniref:Uncharacterized protein n=1 Tax=Xanthomonas oryzae pv. oryzae (strain PXO99A) TaxID=360094 RepID=A0A0K0GQ24_XANOP|nr:hypothetical protein PXO_05746 [Xanthomonas oryzae pv. oryzae PXO99A]